MAKKTAIVGDQYSDVRAGFVQNEKPLIVTITDEKGNQLARMMATPKAFNTGSLGWYAPAKLLTTLSTGKPVSVQVGLNFTCIGSKNQ